MITKSLHYIPALTYINYWTEHSSNDSSAEVQGAAVTYYVPSWAVPCPMFICSLHLEQSRVDSCTALSTLRPHIAMVWSNCLFVVEIQSRAGQIILDMSSLPLVRFSASMLSPVIYIGQWIQCLPSFTLLSEFANLVPILTLPSLTIVGNLTETEFPNTAISLRMYLCLPISNCSGERSFSRLACVIVPRHD